MDQTHFNLGKSLAHLRIVDEFANDADFIRRFENDRDLIKFKDRLKDLSTNSEYNLIIEKLDHNECSLDAPFLKDNCDLFLLLLFRKEIPQLCTNLGKHLNDCYQCFQIFSQVMQDYYQEYQQIYSAT
jgi:hypothetical protein